jgi:hypothetical protein
LCRNKDHIYSWSYYFPKAVVSHSIVPPSDVVS